MIETSYYLRTVTYYLLKNFKLQENMSNRGSKQYLIVNGKILGFKVRAKAATVL